MKNVIKGSLLGYLCDDCTESVSNVKIRLYLPKENQQIELINVKNTFELLTDKKVKAKERYLVGEGFTDESGNFEIELNKNYKEGSIELNFECSAVPNSLHKSGKFPTRQFSVVTFKPNWEINENQNIQLATYSYSINSKWWCYIRGVLFDSWVICGKLLNCKTGKPINGATITAIDADFLTDDILGTDVTDSNGHFRIDYTSKTFKQTFLSPWINIETDPGLPLKFQSGPDVYFKAELAGEILLNETKKDARKNVGHCLCVKLCSEINVVDPNDPTFPSAWTGIGDAFSASHGSGPKDFDTNGFAGAGKFALYKTINLTGQAALKSVSGNPIEYRFVISDITTPNGGASPASSNFTKIIGVTPGLFVSSEVLILSKKITGPSNNEISVFSKQEDFDANGWFDANKAIDRTLVEEGLTPADLSLYNIIESDTLISLNTRALTTATNVPDTIAPGDAVPNANKIPIEKVAIRFEIREVINKAADQFNSIPGSGKTLNSVVMNNNPVFMKLSIKELEDLGDCTPIKDIVHAKYTIYHPHLVHANLRLRNNNSTVNRDIIDGILPPNPIPTDGELHNVSPATPIGSSLNNPPTNPDDLIRCTYLLRMAARARLHTGESSSTNQYAEQLFFYDV